MNLYAVTVMYTTVIRAASEGLAEAQAERVIKANFDDADVVSARKIVSKSDLPNGWTADCRPWGERDAMDRNIGQLLDNQP